MKQKLRNFAAEIRSFVQDVQKPENAEAVLVAGAASVASYWTFAGLLMVIF